jgi:hypothetical protein
MSIKMRFGSTTSTKTSHVAVVDCKYRTVIFISSALINMPNVGQSAEIHVFEVYILITIRMTLISS